MKFIKVDTYNELSREAALVIASQLKSKPDSVLGLATGSSPVGTYRELIKMYENGELDFSSARSVNLDEYVGLSPEDTQSYAFFMRTNLFDHVNIKKENTNIPNGIAEDLDAECRRYDKLVLELGGVDLQLLGIGTDGHIGFNEPDSVFSKLTHTVRLAQSTIDSNARFFESADKVPTTAITVGMMTIMQARSVLLVANGPSKRDILNKALNGPITPEIPASILQLHPHVTVIYSEN